MTTVYSMGIHGHSMNIEDMSLVDHFVRLGFAIEIRGRYPSSNWFHFAIPTPLVISNKQQKINSVWFTYKASDPNTFIKQIGVYDGQYLIIKQDGMKLSSQDYETYRLEIPNKPIIRYAVGISIQVVFGNPDVFSHCRIQFNYAGCDFIE